MINENSKYFVNDKYLDEDKFIVADSLESWWLV